MLFISLLRRAVFVESMFTMGSTPVKNLPLEEKFPPDAVRRCHEARNIPCFNFFIQKEDNVHLATIDLLIESEGLPNHFLLFGNLWNNS